MNYTLIKTWLQNPSAITNDDAEEIRKAIEVYPYFAALKVLLAKAENGEAKVVKSAAAYVSHRPSLQNFLNTSFDTNINLPNTSGIEIETDEVEMLDHLSSEQEVHEDNNISNNTEPDLTSTEEIESNQIIDPIVEEPQEEINLSEDFLEKQIINDLEASNSLENDDTPTSNSIADQVLAELSKMSSENYPEEEFSEDIEGNNKIEVDTINQNSDENPLDITSTEDEDVENIMSSDEMLNRFQGFLNTRKKEESEIIDELSQEENIDSDILNLSKTSPQSYSVEDAPEDIIFNDAIVPLYDINLPDDTTKDTSYNESLTNMNDENIIDHQQFTPESIMSTQQNIINSFIKENPSISPLSKDDGSNTENKDLVSPQSFEETIPKTESFAKMLAKQGKKEEAISIYQHLILKNPNKATFFAERIEFLRKN